MKLKLSIRTHLTQDSRHPVLNHVAENSTNSFFEWLTETWIQLPTCGYTGMPHLPWYNGFCMFVRASAHGLRECLIYQHGISYILSK